MPEGPEVKITARELGTLLVGKKILKIQRSRKSKVRLDIKGLNLIRGSTCMVKSVTCKGKQIFIGLLIERTKILFMRSFLAMSGSWSSSKVKDWSLRIAYSDGSSIIRHLYYIDRLGHGSLSFITEYDYMAKIDSLGPDILSTNVCFERWKRYIVSKSRRTTQICAALLSQSKISGVGNYLKCDILYAARVMPNRVMSNLSDEELLRIFTESVKIIRLSYADGGYSFKDWISPLGNKGMYDPLIYGKEIDPLGNKVEMTKFGDRRLSYFVPSVQV